uniref:Uncharacterized protein n=1 Tax=Arundo donax TaxID=35708 RepID=A0A0A9E0V9_ARUDO
MDSRPAAIPIS